MLADIRHDRGVVIVVPNLERVTIEEAAALSDTLGELAGLGDCVVVDMSRIRLVDSSGLGVFLSAQRAAIASGGALRLANLRPQVATLFRVVRMDSILGVFATVEQAADDWASRRKAAAAIGTGPDGSEQG